MGEKGYKGFKKGMVCKKEKKYKENITYEENGNDICKSGVMHYCENPFDVLDYYPLVEKYGGNRHILKDAIRDKAGDYHDSIIYEIIKDKKINN